MHLPYRKRDEREATHIECLACGASRLVDDTTPTKTGECPRCGYTGWTYAEELDGTTSAMMATGSFEGSPSRPAPKRGWRRT